MHKPAPQRKNILHFDAARDDAVTVGSYANHFQRSYFWKHKGASTRRTQHRHCVPYVDFHQILLQHEKVASMPAIRVCTVTKSSVFAPRSDKQPCQHLTTKFSYRPDALPEAQPTASKHRRQLSPSHTLKCYSKFEKRKPLLYQQSLV